MGVQLKVNLNKTIVLGKGFLGQEFARQGYTIWGHGDPIFPSKGLYFFDALQPYETIINCVAKSNTRWCQDRKNLDEVMYSNSDIVGILSEYCKDHKKKFVHISTGCLYDVFHPRIDYFLRF